jgi:Zn-dependent protease
VLVITLAVALVAVMLHEMSHAACASLLGGRVVGVVVRPTRIAVVVDAGGSTVGSAIPVALAGPAADAVCAFMVLAAGHLGLLSTQQTLYAFAWPALSLAVNLLPIPGADGWRVARTAAAVWRARGAGAGA